VADHGDRVLESRSDAVRLAKVADDGGNRGVRESSGDLRPDRLELFRSATHETDPRPARGVLGGEGLSEAVRRAHDDDALH